MHHGITEVRRKRFRSQRLAPSNDLSHWDMDCDMRSGGSISVEGKVVHENGKFLEVEL